MIGKPNATVRAGRGHVTRLRIYGTPNLRGKRRGGSGFWLNECGAGVLRRRGIDGKGTAGKPG